MEPTDFSPIKNASITANTAAMAVFIVVRNLKRKGLLDDEALSHLRHLLDGQLEMLPDEDSWREMHQRWRRQIDE